MPQTESTHSGVEWIVGNMKDAKSREALITDSQTLVHLACSSHPRTTHVSSAEDIENNLIPTVMLFEEFARTNPKGHIIFASTAGDMYNDSTPDEPSTENHLPHPQSEYGINKLAAENYLRNLSARYGISSTILRISNPYGTVLSSKRMHGLIGVALSCLLKSEPICIFDSLHSVRDYIDLSDVATAFQLVVDNPPPSAACALYNVSTCKGTSISEILDILESISNHSFVRKMNAHTNAPTSRIISFNKINQALAWQPKVSLKEGIEKMWHAQTQSVLI